MTRREKRSTEVPPEVVAELLELARSRTMARVGRSISEAVLFRSRVAATFVVLVAAALGYSAALPLARLLAALFVPWAMACFPEAIALGADRLAVLAFPHRVSPPSWVLAGGWILLVVLFAWVLVSWMGR